MKKVFLFALVLTLMFSCKESTDQSLDNNQKVEEKEAFVSIEELFTETTFADSTMDSLLKEINICSMDSTKAAETKTAFCSAKNFKFFPLAENMSLKNGFILLIKAQTAGFPLRRLLVFQRDKGGLVKVNGFVANLIGRIKTESGYDDLLLRFNDKDGSEDMFYNCLFTWNGGQYEYKQVERIEGSNWGGPVKAAYKDSISKEIYQNIMNNQMIF